MKKVLQSIVQNWRGEKVYRVLDLERKECLEGKRLCAKTYVVRNYKELNNLG
jgi:hypothetical protein